MTSTTTVPQASQASQVAPTIPAAPADRAAPATEEAAPLDLRLVERFLYREARLADEHDYDGWEALWTDDGVYWVPANGDDTDPATAMSVIHDNRGRIATRIRQLD